MRVNEQGTTNVCQVASKAGVGHLILISSVSVYGPYTQGMYSEDAPCLPEGPYAESKYQAERRAIEIAYQYGISLMILRLATLYGENDPGNVARLMRAIDRGRFIWIGDGSNIKSLLYCGDAARACIMATFQSSTGVKIYNVSAQPSTMYEVIEGLIVALGRDHPRLHVPASPMLMAANFLSRLAGNRGRLGDLRNTLKKWLADDAYDAGQFNKTFGFQTEVDLTEGLRREVKWYHSQIRTTST